MGQSWHPTTSDLQPRTTPRIKPPIETLNPNQDLFFLKLKTTAKIKPRPRSYETQVYLQAHLQSNKPPPTIIMNSNSNNTGATGAAKGVTSLLGNTVGGLTNTVGGVVGALGRGLGETVNGATGGIAKPVGDGVANIGTGVEQGASGLAKGVKDAGEWKS